MSFIKEVSLIKTCLETKENKKPEEKPKFAAKRKASSGKTNERGAGFGGVGEEGGLPTCVQVRQIEVRVRPCVSFGTFPRPGGLLSPFPAFSCLSVAVEASPAQQPAC